MDIERVKILLARDEKRREYMKQYREKKGRGYFNQKQREFRERQRSIKNDETSSPRSMV